VRIGELATRSGLSASRIRFYEAQGLIRVPRRANGYRSYSAETLAALNLITSAQGAGFTLEEIRRLSPGDVSAGQSEALLGALRGKLADIGAMELRLAQTRRRLEAVIADIEARPEGMSCAENTDRVMRNFEANR
jgi:DNA-binding transcriptional MerR regulator